MARKKLNKQSEIRSDLMNENEAERTRLALIEALNDCNIETEEGREALTRFAEAAMEIEGALEIEIMPVGIFGGVEFGE